MSEEEGPTPEEVYEAIRPKIGERAARALIDFIVLCGERMPTVMEVIDTYDALRTAFEAKEALLIMRFILEMAERKHGRPF